MMRASRRPASEIPVSQRILEVAEQLAQTRGFNGFSYADVAEKLHVTKASLHYHFPSKADLGRALIERYHVVFVAALEAIDREAQGGPDKLRRYAGLYDSVMRNDRLCLCGMLAAEYSTLPAPMQAELRRFFDANEVWLAAVLEDGRRAGKIGFAERRNNGRASFSARWRARCSLRARTTKAGASSPRRSKYWPTSAPFNSRSGSGARRRRGRACRGMRPGCRPGRCSAGRRSRSSRSTR